MTTTVNSIVNNLLFTKVYVLLLSSDIRTLRLIKVRYIKSY